MAEEQPNAMRAMVRVRMSENDVHYGGGLVSGARVMELFGDVATEVLIHLDGDEGLFAAYDLVEFLAPVHAGDFLEVYGTLESVGNTSRRLSFKAYKVVQSQSPFGGEASAADILEPPLLVARASGTCVVPKDRQRRKT